MGDHTTPGPAVSLVSSEDPNGRNLCAEVSVTEKQVYNAYPSHPHPVHIALIDCGVKQNIIRSLTRQGAKVTVVPWDYNLCSRDAESESFDGVFISNGPGDPRTLCATVNNVKAFMEKQKRDVEAGDEVVVKPIFGICMGNLVLGMAAGLDVYKLPYGNRGHNQPCVDLTTGRCVITSQNHGYALDDSVLENADSISAANAVADDSAVAKEWTVYFRNANDGSNEGIKHATLPYSSVQFHPEAMGGPEDTQFLFVKFVEDVRHARCKRLEGVVVQQQQQQVQSSAVLHN